MKATRTAPKPVPIAVEFVAKVPRPVLTKDEAILEATYRPKASCGYCAKQCAVTTHRANGGCDYCDPAPQWLMEKPRPGHPFAFYCTNCGMYRYVEVGA